MSCGDTHRLFDGRTLANPNTSEEAKAHAREMLAKAGQSVGGDTRDKEHEEHVIRGYKA